MDMSHKLPILTGDDSPGSGQADVAIDPVCGMKVDKKSAKHTLMHEGHTVYFCSKSCKERFSANPSAFDSKRTDASSGAGQHCCETDEKPPAAAVQPGAIYTCPMHPEVRQVGPGTCPKCGMALEPESFAPPAE